MTPLLKNVSRHQKFRANLENNHFIHLLVTVVSVALVTFARMSVTPLIGHRAPWIFYFLAILVSSAFGGWFFGFLATALGLFFGVYLFIDPIETFELPLLEDQFTSVFFVLIGFSISIIMDRLNRSVRKNRRIREEIAESQEMMSIALSAARMVAWSWTIGRPTIDQSVNTEAVFGMKMRTFSELLSIVHRDDVGLLEEQTRKTVDQGGEHILEYRVIRPDNHKLIWVEDRAEGIKDENGNVIRISGVFTDITERKETEQELYRYAEELRLAKDAAETASKTKSQFLANMSHEMRTPLGVVLGYAELLQGPEISDADRQEYLKVILRNGDLLSKVINEILDLSRIESNKMTIELESFNLADLIQEVKNFFQLKSQDKGLNLRFKIEDGVPDFLYTDSLRLKQILINLIGNSIKFTERGMVELMIRPLPGSPNEIEFLISDTGPGIETHFINDLFLPFSQVDSTMTRKYGGSGLGLALSKRFAKALGGDLRLLKTTLGVGTTFQVILPVRLDDAGIEKF